MAAGRQLQPAIRIARAQQFQVALKIDAALVLRQHAELAFGVPRDGVGLRCLAEHLLTEAGRSVAFRTPVPLQQRTELGELHPGLLQLDDPR